MNHKKNLLFLLKLPPPKTGATFMNQIINENEAINKLYCIEKIDISYASSINNLGRFQLKKIYIYIKVIFKLFKYLITKNIHIIYFQPSINGVSYFRDVILILIGKLFGKKFILHLHGKGISNYSKKSLLHRWLYNIGFKNQYLIVLSENQIADVSFLNPKKIFVVNNGIPSLQSNSTSLPVKTKDPTRLRFLYLSNLLKSKGVLDLLDTALELKKNTLDFCIDIVGSEGDINENELLKKINALQLNDHVYYHGPKYDHDKIYFLKQADAFVFPTQNEAFGIVLLEAMQFELAIIATDEGAIPEIIENGKSGYIYPKKVKHELFNYMSHLIKHPNLCINLGKRGKEIYFEKFTINILEKNMISVFNTCLKEQK